MRHEFNCLCSQKELANIAPCYKKKSYTSFQVPDSTNRTTVIVTSFSNARHKKLAELLQSSCDHNLFQMRWKCQFQEAAPPLGTANCFANTMENSIPKGGASSWNRGLPRIYNGKVDPKKPRLSWNRHPPRNYDGKVDSKKRCFPLESQVASQIKVESRFQEDAPPLGIAGLLANAMENCISSGGFYSWNRCSPRKYNGKTDSKRRRFLSEPGLALQLHRKNRHFGLPR